MGGRLLSPEKHSFQAVGCKKEELWAGAASSRVAATSSGLLRSAEEAEPITDAPGGTFTCRTATETTVTRHFEGQVSNQ